MELTRSQESRELKFEVWNVIKAFTVCYQNSEKDCSLPFESHKNFPREVTEEGNGNPLQYSCLENPMDRGTC